MATTTRTAARARTLGLALALVLAAPRAAGAQSWYLDWLKRVEEWSLKEDYRGWIFHGAIAAAVTFAADRLVGRPAYGAAMSSGFYLGKEIHESAIWDGFSTDRILDMTTPVVAAVAAALVLRDDPARSAPPRILPPPLPAPCARAAPPAGAEPGPEPGAPATSPAPPPGPRRAPPYPWLCLAAADPLDRALTDPGPAP